MDYRAEHVRSRSKRYGTGEFDVEPEWATEAALDRHRLAGPSTIGESLQVVGYSTACGRILKVWLYPKDIEAGEWYGRLPVKRTTRTSASIESIRREGNER
jgi:hypothetical protein